MTRLVGGPGSSLAARLAVELLCRSRSRLLRSITVTVIHRVHGHVMHIAMHGPRRLPSRAFTAVVWQLCGCCAGGVRLSCYLQVLDDLLADQDPTTASYAGGWQSSAHALVEDAPVRSAASEARADDSFLRDISGTRAVPTARAGFERRHMVEPNGTSSPPPDGDTKAHWNRRLLATAVDALIPLVDTHYRPGLSLGFQFQARAIDTLEHVLLAPLLTDARKDVAILQVGG